MIKTILVSSLIIMALSVVTQQQAKALTESQKSMIMKFTSECIKELGLPADHILTKAESMTGCKDALKHLFNQEGGAQAYLDVYKFG
jgi:hypothetical protein